jgi:hypothetical protein
METADPRWLAKLPDSTSHGELLYSDTSEDLLWR